MPLDDTEASERTLRFASNLDRMMTLRGIKNPWLGDRLGVSRQAVHQWRNAETYPVGYMKSLCRILGCTENDLIKPPFAANLANLMDARNINSGCLAARIGVSETVMDAWLLGEAKPSQENLRALATILECTVSDIMEAPNVLTLSMWAKRENIPITRAQSLFDLKILTGEIKTEFGLLIPTGIKAPAASKKLVITAKHRPKWGLKGQYNFVHNFNLMTNGIKIAMLAKLFGVNATTIIHWQLGERSPDEDRIPQIAEVLSCSVETLMADSPEATEAMTRALATAAVKNRSIDADMVGDVMAILG